MPDGFAYWELHGRQGMFAFELDRGTESFATLVGKLDSYDAWWKRRRSRSLAQGIAIKPRLALVANAGRAQRLAQNVEERLALSGTVLIAQMEVALARPLSTGWYRSDIRRAGYLLK